MAIAHFPLETRTADLLGRMAWRNRTIGLLRIIVPALGLVAFLALAAQIYIANIARQYGISGIRIDRGALVVETPQYSGMGTDGSRYVVNASEARSPIGKTNLIDMTTATLDFTRPAKAAFHVASPTAKVDTDTSIVIVPGVATVTSDDGLHGTLEQVRADMHKEITTADGPVDITFGDGTHLTGSDMYYDGKAELWIFHNSTLIIPQLPKSKYDTANSWIPAGMFGNPVVAALPAPQLQTAPPPALAAPAPVAPVPRMRP